MNYPLLALSLCLLFLVFTFGMTFWNKGRLFTYFLFVVFSASLIPSVAGFEVPFLGLVTFQKTILFVLATGILFAWHQLDSAPPDRRVQFVLVVLIVTRLISVLYSGNLQISFLFWASSLFYWYFFYYVALRLVKTDLQIRQVIKIFVLSGMVVAAFNFIELLTGFYAPHLFPGVAESLAYWQYDRVGVTRVFGLLGDPVATAYYLVPVIPFGLYLFEESRAKKWLLVTAFLLSGLLLNLSRASILAVATMGLLYLVFSRKQSVLIWGFVAVGLLLVVVIDNPARSLIAETLNPTTTESRGLQQILTQRAFGIIDVVPQILRDLPSFGYGTGSMVRGPLMDLYYQKAGYLYYNRTEFPGFVSVTIESGILAGVAFTVLFVMAVYRSFRAATRVKGKGADISLYVFFSLVGYTICILFNGVFSSLYVFFLLLGILTVKTNGGKATASSVKLVE